jgi:four helix bundle protein
MEFAKNFTDLKVYKLAQEAAMKIFEISKTFPKEERYSLTDQMRRSSRSVGGQIAEAWGKRRYERHFISKITDADAEGLETQHWIASAHLCQYIDQSTERELLEGYLSIGRMLNAMIMKSGDFCISRNFQKE